MSENRKSGKPAAISVIAVILIAVVFMVAATGCKKSPKDTDVNNPVKDSTEVEVPNDTDGPEVPVEDPDSEVVTEDPVEPGNTDEPTVEMVDWETWATQADNDEVCLVVWNETTGTQKILQPTTDEKPFIYNVEEGDRFAVPKRDNIMSVSVGFEENFYWQSAEQKYIELEIPVGEKKVIYIACENEEWARSYLFNF